MNLIIVFLNADEIQVEKILYKNVFFSEDSYAFGFRFDDPIFRLATDLKSDEVKSTTKKILLKPESRASETAYYYEESKEMEAELKNFGIKDKADSKKRTRTKTEFYDPGIPAKTNVKRVRTKAELKQEPPGQQPSGYDISRGVIKLETSGLESLQVEPFLSSNTNSLINQSGMNLPCLSTDPTFNPMAQLSLSSVPWMVPNAGPVSNSFPNPMMMYPGMLPTGVGPSFMATPTGNFLHSGTSEYLNEHMQSFTGAKVRKNKKRGNKKLNPVHNAPNARSASVKKPTTSRDRLCPDAESQMIMNAVALEHSYTMRPDAINSKRKSLKYHTDASACSSPHEPNHSKLKVDGTGPQKTPSSASIPTENFSNTSPKRLNKRCSTVKQLLEKPTMLDKASSKTPVVNNTASGSETTAVKPLVNSAKNEQPSIKELQTTANQQQAVSSHQSAAAIQKSDMYIQDQSHLPSSEHLSRSLNPTLQKQESQVLPSEVNGPASAVATPVSSAGSLPGSCCSLDNKAKLSSVPSITHAIEMVKLQQQGALNRDSTNTVHSKKPATKTAEEHTEIPYPDLQETTRNDGTLATKTGNKKSEPTQILSQLSSPPIAPVIDVKLQKQVQDFDVCNNGSKLSTTAASSNPGVSSTLQLSCLSNREDTSSTSTVTSQMSTMQSVTAHTPLQTSSQIATPSSTNSAVQSPLPSKKGQFQPTGKRDLTVKATNTATSDANKQQDPPPVDNNSGKIAQEHNVEHSESSSTSNLPDEFIPTGCNEPKKLEVVAPVITTQTLQEALTQLSSVSSIAIPPKVADLVLHCPQHASKSPIFHWETKETLETITEHRRPENSSSGIPQGSHLHSSQNRSEKAKTSVSTQNTTLEKPPCVKHETAVTAMLASPVTTATFTQNGSETILPVKKTVPSTDSNQVKNQCDNETSSQTVDSLKQYGPHLPEEKPAPECSGISQQHDHGLSGPENTLVTELSATTPEHQPQGNTESTAPASFVTTQVVDASIPPHESPPVVTSMLLSTTTAAAPLRPPPPLLHISQLQTLPVKIPQLASPENESQFLTEGPPALQIPTASDPVMQAENLLSPQQNGKLPIIFDQTNNSSVAQIPGQLGALAPNLFTTQNIPLLNEQSPASYDVLSPAGVFANPQLSQAFFDGMNQAFNAQMLSQMALSQFGGFQQQMPSALPLFNMIMQDSLQGNLAAVPQLQHAQMLGLTLPNFGTPGLPIGDPNLLGSFHYAGGMSTPPALSGQLATNAMARAVQNTTSSFPQDIHKTVESGCSKGKRKSKESQSSPIDSEQYLPKHDNTENTSMASKTSDPAETVATAPNTIQFDQSSHLNCSTNQSEDSGTHSLPGSKVNEPSDETEVASKDIRRKDRSESQDSNSTLSDGESPVSTPTTTSVPGWFGKGLNLKKGRRKRSK